jgi:hypothetical protein
MECCDLQEVYNQESLATQYHGSNVAWLLHSSLPIDLDRTPPLGEPMLIRSPQAESPSASSSNQALVRAHLEYGKRWMCTIVVTD